MLLYFLNHRNFYKQRKRDEDLDEMLLNFLIADKEEEEVFSKR
jgi:hypothetical protein